MAQERNHQLPLLIPRRATLPGLVCEVLHPDAHWTGTLERRPPPRSESAAPHRLISRSSSANQPLPIG